jgi:hypothetical protein
MYDWPEGLSKTMKNLSQNIVRCDQRTQPGFTQRLRSIVKIYLGCKNVTLARRSAVRLC